MIFTVFHFDNTAYVSDFGDRDNLPLLRCTDFGQGLFTVEGGGLPKRRFKITRTIYTSASTHTHGECELIAEVCDCGECDHCSAAFKRRMMRRGSRR